MLKRSSEEYIFLWIKDKVDKAEYALFKGDTKEALTQLDILLTQLNNLTTPDEEKNSHEESNPD